MNELSHVAVYLAAAVVCVAAMKRVGYAAVLGYLLAGAAIGPWGLGMIDDINSVRHLSEFGVVLLLFVIGLELQPSRLWALRRPVFGMGSAQVILTGLLLTVIGLLAGLPLTVALVTGLGLAMSSTAFVLQLLAEKHELGMPHGRASFAILLLQDIAVIPLLAIIPLLASGVSLAQITPDLGLLKILAVIALLFPLSRFVLRPAFVAVAKTEVPELFTALALLVVVATAWLMESVGTSVTLGAFLAGVLLADSEYRHEIETRLAPFEGLLLGLFFISVGMSANFGLIAEQPLRIAGLVVGLVVVKFCCLYGVARVMRMTRSNAIKLAAALCQGGEFAFILFALARDQRLMDANVADTLMLVVSLSMVLTPFIYSAATRFAEKAKDERAARPYDEVTNTDHMVVIAGLGRFGQIAGRILRGLEIPFTALDIDPEHIELSRRFGSKAYYGDASNLDLLKSAHLENAKVIIIAIDNPDASVRTAALVHEHFPHVEILARARNRQHVYRLMDVGVTFIERELYHSSLHLSEQLLVTLGFSFQQARRAVTAFRKNDEAALQKAHAVYKDEAQLIQSSKEAAAELRAILEADPRLAASRD